MSTEHPTPPSPREPTRHAPAPRWLRTGERGGTWRPHRKEEGVRQVPGRSYQPRNTVLIPDPPRFQFLDAIPGRLLSTSISQALLEALTVILNARLPLPPPPGAWGRAGRVQGSRGDGTHILDGQVATLGLWRQGRGRTLAEIFHRLLQRLAFLCARDPIVRTLHVIPAGVQVGLKANATGAL